MKELIRKIACDICYSLGKPELSPDYINPGDWLLPDAIKLIDFTKLTVPLVQPPKVWIPSVISGSMQPMMGTGPGGLFIHKNILIAGNNRADHQLLIDHLQRGDIAVYQMFPDRYDEGYVMHRISKLKHDEHGRLFTFRGDNPYITEDDKWIVRDENIIWIWVGMLA